jgi:polysaccharide biosynthesis transport protein
MSNRTGPPNGTGRELVLHQGHHGDEPQKFVYLEPFDSQPARQNGEHNALLETWHLLRSRLWVILLVALLGGAIGSVLTFQQTPSYRATGSIEIQAPAESALGFQAAAPSGADGAPDTYIHTQVKVLESRALRKRVIAKLTETKRLSSFAAPDWASRWKRALSSFSLEGLRGLFSAERQRTAEVPHVPAFVFKVDYDETRVVELICESPDPKFSADYINTVAEEYTQMQGEARFDAAKRTSSWLTLQVEDMRHQLEQSEDRLQGYARSTGMIISDGEKDNVPEEKLKELQAELSKANAERVEKQSVYEIATSSPAESIPQVIDNERLSGYQVKLADLRRNLAELRSIYTPDHPRVKQVEAQIAALDSTFQKERDGVIARIRNDFQAAQRRESLLNAAYAAQTQVVSDRSAKLATYDILRREVETNRQLYGALLQKIKESGVASAISASNIRVVDAAEVPFLPFRPVLSTNLAEGLVSGLLLGIVLIVLSDRINRSLKSPGEAAFHLRVPELGVIPSYEAMVVRPSDNGIRAHRGLDLNGHVNGNGNGAAVEDRVELVTSQDSPSAFAESFRNVLTSILLCNSTDTRPQIIVVTSATRQEGKSTSVSNLGLALAEIGQKVLLIDADMRKPRLHQIFSTPNSWGLSDLLREKTPLKDCPLEAIARATQYNGLYLLPSGPATLSTSNLLYSIRVSELLQRVRTDFDTILIDTPPLLNISDARVIGRLADAAILVIRAGQTTRDLAMTAKQRLVDDGIAVLGTVLNRWDLKSTTRYSYYSESYQDEMR